MVLMEMEDSRSRSSGFSGAVNAFAKWLAKAEETPRTGVTGD